jgi:hypothetical protein
MITRNLSAGNKSETETKVKKLKEVAHEGLSKIPHYPGCSTFLKLHKLFMNK